VERLARSESTLGGRRKASAAENACVLAPAGGRRRFFTPVIRSIVFIRKFFGSTSEIRSWLVIVQPPGQLLMISTAFKCSTPRARAAGRRARGRRCSHLRRPAPARPRLPDRGRRQVLRKQSDSRPGDTSLRCRTICA